MHINLQTEKESLLLSPSLIEKDSFPESQKQHSNQATAIALSSSVREATARTLVAKQAWGFHCFQLCVGHSA